MLRTTSILFHICADIGLITLLTGAYYAVYSLIVLGYRYVRRVWFFRRSWQQIHATINFPGDNPTPVRTYRLTRHYSRNPFWKS